MKPRDDARVAEWLLYSDRDARAAEVLAAEDPSLFLAVGFHAQQAAEKRLKGLLLALDRPFEKTHSLTALLTDLADVLTPRPDVVEAAAWLTSFAVITRYPGFLLPEPDVAGSALRSLAAMRVLCGIVEDAMVRDDHPGDIDP